MFAFASRSQILMNLCREQYLVNSVLHHFLMACPHVGPPLTYHLLWPSGILSVKSVLNAISLMFIENKDPDIFFSSGIKTVFIVIGQYKPTICVPVNKQLILHETVRCFFQMFVLNTADYNVAIYQQWRMIWVFTHKGGFAGISIP